MEMEAAKLIGEDAAAFNNYLDLGAGVLLLWYGGSIAMSPNGTSVLTVGSLIKGAAIAKPDRVFDNPVESLKRI